MNIKKRGNCAVYFLPMTIFAVIFTLSVCPPLSAQIDTVTES